MHGEILMRGIEIFRASECTDCKLIRSNAMRRPKRGVRIQRIPEKLPQLPNKMRFKRIKDIIMLKRRANMDAGQRVPWMFRWRNKKIFFEPVADPRIQEEDGGFFEKFGSLLRQQSLHAKAIESEEKLKVAEQAAEIIKTTEEEEEDAENAELPTVSESETESSKESDSENEERDPTDYLSTAINIEDLYSNILYIILHNVGCEVSCDIGPNALLSYTQDVFKVSNEKHEELLQEAESREPPEIMLNVDVIEAKDLRPKDSNGLSDPFVTLFLASNPTHKYNSSVKVGTLNPTWEEHFALPVADKSSDDTLCIEVWDFDPAETVSEKFGKFTEVKGIKGVRRFLKEIAITATTGQHNNELIGTAKVPLKGLPAAGMTMWYGLDKKNRTTRRGIIKVHITFSSEKNSQVAFQEHRHLLRILLLHELGQSKVAQYYWNGIFSAQADALITQHIAQSGLQPNQVVMAQFIVYSKIHKDYPLSFTLFMNLLEKLIKPIQTNAFSEEELKIFWDAVKKLLPSCFSIIRKIRKKATNEKAAMKQLRDVLYVISKIDMLEPLPDVDLFPSKEYKWLNSEVTPNCDIREALKQAVLHGADSWFNYILDNNVSTDESDDGKLRNLIKIIQLVRTDLQKAIELYDKLFQEIVNLHYARRLYVVYQVRIATLAEPEVLSICKNLKRVSYTGSIPKEQEADGLLTIGTTLFELYLGLQRFVLLGTELCPTEHDTFHIKNFHQWFHAGVAQWLDIAVYKAVQRIKKAVELDKLIPVDATVKYSSSAVDTLSIFYQVKVFWQQLNWPDIEGSYTFIAKIIDDISQCCVTYAKQIAARVEGMGDMEDVYEKKFEVTNEWCLAINNIDYVRQSLIPFTNELEVEALIQKLSDMTSPLDAQRCKHTLDTVIANSIDTVRNKIIELLETVVKKMCPAIKRLLIEGAELFNQDSNSIDRLMMYIDDNLKTLYEQLNEDNFNRTLEIIWENLNYILQDIIQSNLEKRRPPSFFANLNETLKIMTKSFKQSECDSECEALRKTQRMLEINGMETLDLIHQVHLDLWEEQKAISDTNYGQLTIQIQFIENVLKIRILNAKNLIAMDSNGSCDSYVRIHFLPEEKFLNTPKPKTQTKHKSQFPLYDETFVINLTPEQRRIKNGIVHFSVKDYDFLGMNNQYIGEAFINFSEIPDTPKPIDSMPQNHLSLWRPCNFNTEAIIALEYRQGCKLAKEFVKKMKTKYISTG